MEIVPVYQTTAVDREHGFVARVISVPRKSFLFTGLFDNASDLMGFLNLKPIPVPSTESIPPILGLAATVRDVDLLAGMLSDPKRIASLPLDPNLLEFTRSVASTELIVFESSPASVQSIVGALASASPQAAGAIAGYVTGESLGRGGVWVIFTVPAGMILASVARRVGQLIAKGKPLPQALWEVVVGSRSRRPRRRR